jgi:large subunit ribosomal protein L22
MEAKAQVRHVRIAPRKARLVADLVRGKGVQQALVDLRFASKAAVPVVAKLIRSAEANAVNNHNMDKKRLVIKEIYVNEGVRLKRVMPRARGRADRIIKQTSHISIVVAEN